jgi:hypothetical protein
MDRTFVTNSRGISIGTNFSGDFSGDFSRGGTSGTSSRVPPPSSNA